MDASGSAPRRAWHALGPDDALATLSSGPAGLDREEAGRRLQAHGPNVIERRRGEGPLVVLWRQIDNPLIYVLIASGALAIAVGKATDGAVVLAVVVINTVIGFVQEYRAGKAIEALSRMVPETAAVLRGGVRRQVPVAELVPGDHVFLEPGDKVPADLRLLEVRNLRVEEAVLTGESVPVVKQVDAVDADRELGDRASLAFSGTLVAAGTGRGIVVETGARTELGRISELLAETTDLETPLTRSLAQVSKLLTVAIAAVALGLAGIGLFRGYPPADAVLAAIVLAVGAIPEGLPAIMTIALAIGVQRMARRRAVIRRLPAVETLGSTTVICSDKTGTLTRNEMTVQSLWVEGTRYRLGGVGYAPEGELSEDGGGALPEAPEGVRALVVGGALCSDATLEEKDGKWILAGDPTEGALVVAAAKLGLDPERLREAYPRLDVVPFESETQLMATLHRAPDGVRTLYLKGAPEVVLGRVEGADAAAVRAAVDDFAGQGQRVLAVARKRHDADLLAPADLEGGFELLGLEAMIDPPRQEVIDAIAACHAAGVVVKMITGDHALTARAIGVELGITKPGEPVVTGRELADLPEARLAEAARTANVFARVAPEHKLRLVRALQADRQVVAMTGDGVNDAPALEQSNIGVAMGITGTSVSKESADIVLTDDNFASIAAAVEEGRRVYDNLVKSLAFVLPTNLGLALILMVAVALFPIEMIEGQRVPLMPMVPTQILWINLVAAVALALPLAFEVAEPRVMARPPRDPAAPVMSGFVVFRTVLVAVLMTAGAVLMFWWELSRETAAGTARAVALAEAQTMAVTTVIMFQCFYLLNCRSLRASMFAIGLFRNPTVFLGIGVVLILQLGLIYLPFMNEIFDTAPLPPESLLVSAGVGAIILPVITLEKALLARRARRARPARDGLTGSDRDDLAARTDPARPLEP